MPVYSCEYLPRGMEGRVRAVERSCGTELWKRAVEAYWNSASQMLMKQSCFSSSQRYLPRGKEGGQLWKGRLWKGELWKRT